MNSPQINGNDQAACPAANDADATLRLIAGLPAPEGLEERIHAGLRAARPHSAHILSWPTVLGADSPWRRSAAAAAIAFVVVGGGWGVYSRVQPNKVIAMPLPHVAQPGGFSNAGGMATPHTLNGPVLTHPPQAPAVHPGTGVKSDSSHVIEMPAQRGGSPQAAPASKPAAQTEK